jgi:hypothetical protein
MMWLKAEREMKFKAQGSNLEDGQEIEKLIKPNDQSKHRTLYTIPKLRKLQL